MLESIHDVEHILGTVDLIAAWHTISVDADELAGQDPTLRTQVERCQFDSGSSTEAGACPPSRTS